MKGILDFTSAVNTLFRRGNLQVTGTTNGGTGTFPAAGFSHTFGLNPANPYFRIFAGLVGDDSNAFATQFQFTLGGAPCGDPYTVVWGDVANYNASTLSTDTVSGLVITPALGNDALFVESQFANGCGVIMPSLGLPNGFCSRWSALADQIVLTTTCVGGVTALTNNAEYFHGVVQQPY